MVVNPIAVTQWWTLTGNNSPLPVDLLYFGGIGTYVKASSESNADAGDRANDPLRINAADVHAKVVGEGANLGFTQKGRIEAALAGRKINTDALDNSAGVDTSDHEVNIKIALAAAKRSGKLSEPKRVALLESMTDEVAEMYDLNNDAHVTLADVLNLNPFFNRGCTP